MFGESQTKWGISHNKKKVLLTQLLIKSMSLYLNKYISALVFLFPLYSYRGCEISGVLLKIFFHCVWSYCEKGSADHDNISTQFFCLALVQSENMEWERFTAHTAKHKGAMFELLICWSHPSLNIMSFHDLLLLWRYAYITFTTKGLFSPYKGRLLPHGSSHSIPLLWLPLNLTIGLKN